MRDAIASRLAECGLELNEHKTRIVYCKDDDRRGSYEHDVVRFPRATRSARGCRRASRAASSSTSSPAVCDDARKRMRREIRRWRLHLRPDKTLTDLARMFNPIIQGWINYYGRFYRSVLIRSSRHINAYLVRWAQCQVQAAAPPPRPRRAGSWPTSFRRQPGLFAHWRFGVRPDGWTMGAR